MTITYEELFKVKCRADGTLHGYSKDSNVCRCGKSNLERFCVDCGASKEHINSYGHYKHCGISK